MKELIQLQNVQMEIQDHILFEKVTASVQKGDIIGIIGKNGAGKSTLLQILNKQREPSDGVIRYLEENAKVLMVEQETESYSLGEVSSEEASLLEKWDVPDQDFENLSGGEKLKRRLARAFTARADLLLLDEPTNHLDEKSTELLIQLLKECKETVILVSHDRYFLDAAATKIWSFEQKTLITHKGSYSSYIKFREQQRLAQQRAYDKQQAMVERIEGQMKQLTSWSQKAHANSTKQGGYKEYFRKKAKKIDVQVKSKQKRLEKELERVKAEQVQPEYEVKFTLKPNLKKGKRFLEVKNLSKSFDERVLFHGASFTVQHGEKVAVTGPNGSGKTTLLRMITGEESGEGDIWISPAADFGYLTQEVFDLPLDQRPEELFHRDSYEERGLVQNLMKHLGFTAAQWKEPIREMSMGERVKCKLMTYILEEKDALILDEPTNHLDLASREQLEETLMAYSGTLLVVSHDRYFLDKVTNAKLIFAERRIHKQLQKTQAPPKPDEREEQRLKLETERQEVLGKLSFLPSHDKTYAELDRKFNELTKRINELK